MDVTTTPWIVLNELMEHGMNYERDRAEKNTKPDRTAKKQKWQRIRVIDPW